MPTSRNDSLITEQLLHALALKESGGKQQTVGDKNLSNHAYGMYQIRKPAYLDVVRLRKDLAAIPFSQVQADQQMNETFAKAYLSVLSNEYGLNTTDRMLQGYNAGPTAVRKGVVPQTAVQYSQDIQRMMRGGK